MIVKHRRIFLRDFSVMLSIGIHDVEKAAPQRVMIDVDIDLDPTMGADGDHIASVLDYDFLRRGITQMVAGRHFNLQETLCEAVIDLCFAQPEVIRARVTTAKPDVYPDCRAVGYEMIAER